MSKPVLFCRPSWTPNQARREQILDEMLFNTVPPDECHDDISGFYLGVRSELAAEYWEQHPALIPVAWTCFGGGIWEGQA